jgi:Tol biopolymer transport system component
MALAPGTRLGPYTITAPLGAGGMGEVYKASDTNLGRQVAIKVLPEAFAQDADRLSRFEREARTLATLNHTNIAQIYGLERSDRALALVMELVEGPTLADRIAQGTIPVDEALPIAKQIAEALEAAHEQGIIHRDLKPANIKVRPDGTVKVLDFGLAKALEPEQPSVIAESATMTHHATRAGVILGTVAYMSPEQARGETIDHRSDLFTLGVVLQEMLTGECPYLRGSAAETLGAILKETPPTLDAAHLGAPTDLISRLQHVLDKCLAKDRGERYQTIKDLTLDLKWIHRDSDSERARPSEHTSSKSSGVVAAISVAVLLIVGALALKFWPRAERVPRLVNPIQVTTAIGMESGPTWSPESGMLAYYLDPVDYSGNTDIWATQVGSGQPLNLTADHAGADAFPSYSPDGRQIAFWSSRDGGGYFVMPALGGPPRRIVADSGLGSATRPQWSSDGKRLACVVHHEASPMAVVVSLDTGESRRIALPGRSVNTRLDLAWSPDGRYFAYVDTKADSSQVRQILVIGVEDGTTSEVTDGRTNVASPSWSREGRALYYVSNRGGSMDLWRQGMRGGQPVGAPLPMTTGVGVSSAAFSPDGKKLAYSKGRVMANVWRAPILPDRPARWSDAQQVTFDDAYVEMVDVSRDGERVIISSDRAGNPDLWVLPSAGGAMQQVTTDPTPDWAPRWSPDGKEIAFYANRSGKREIWVQPFGGGPARQITRSEVESSYPDWSPDGREIVFYSARERKQHLGIVAGNGGEAREVTEGSIDINPSWSPDGTWLAFVSYRSGEPRLWRVPSKGGEAQKLSEVGGDLPRWSPDGKWIYFVGDGTSSGNLWAVPAAGGPARTVTDLVGKRGTLEVSALATDGKFLYFSWREGLGDIWVMDVVDQ